MREDGLSVSKMNISYGGSVSKMHDSIIKEVGPFESELKVGDTQTMVYTKHDKGPF